MKLVFYSGGQNPSNKRLHSALADLSGIKKHKSFSYVPFCSDGSEVFYNRAKKRYSKFGFDRFSMFPVDQPKIAKNLSIQDKIFNSDVIYLAGGNTFYFLYHLKKNKLITKFRKFAENGGVLAGLSAGGIIMTPNINLAGYPKFDADRNEVNLKDLKSLGLVKWEFYPHYRTSYKLNDAFKKYTKKLNHPVMTCADGAGIIIHDTETVAFGKGAMYYKGERMPFSLHSSYLSWK